MNVCKWLKDWWNGINICPKCGAIQYKFSFYTTRWLCRDCWLAEKHAEITGEKEG